MFIELISRIHDILDSKARRDIVKLFLVMLSVAVAELSLVFVIGPYLGVLISGDLDLIISVKDFLPIIDVSAIDDLQILLYASIVCGAMLLAISSISFFGMRAIVLEGYLIGANLSGKCFDNLIETENKKLKWLEKTDITNDLGYETQRFANQVLVPLLLLLNRLIIIFALVIGLIVYNFLYGIILSILFCFLYYFIIRVIKHRLVKNSSLITSENIERLSSIDKTVQGLPELTILSARDLFANTYHEATLGHSRALAMNGVLATSPRYILEAIVLMSVLAAATVMLSEGSVHTQDMLGTFAVYGIASLKLLPNAQQAYTNLVSVKSNLSSLTRIEHYLNLGNHHFNASSFGRETDIRESFDGTDSDVVVKQVSVTKGDRKLLQNATIVLSRGGWIGIVGESGCGKSTLLDVILGFQASDGEGLERVYFSPRVNIIAYCPSTPFLFNGRLWDNLFFGKRVSKNDVAKADEILERLCLSSIKNGQSIESDACVLDPRTLSNGQKQRIGVARALLANPDLIIFDEATSALDGAMEEVVMDMVNQYRATKCCSLISVAHRMKTLEDSDQIYVMRKGKLVCRGCYHELQNSCEEFRRLSSVTLRAS